MVSRPHYTAAPALSPSWFCICLCICICIRICVCICICWMSTYEYKSHACILHNCSTTPFPPPSSWDHFFFPCKRINHIFRGAPFFAGLATTPNKIQKNKNKSTGQLSWLYHNTPNYNRPWQFIRKTIIFSGKLSCWQKVIWCFFLRLGRCTGAGGAEEGVAPLSNSLHPPLGENQPTSIPLRTNLPLYLYTSYRLTPTNFLALVVCSSTPYVSLHFSNSVFFHWASP